MSMPEVSFDVQHSVSQAPQPFVRGMVAFCLKGHKMTCETPTVSWKTLCCDRCQMQLPPKTARFSCAACDYDCCITCGSERSEIDPTLGLLKDIDTRTAELGLRERKKRASPEPVATEVQAPKKRATRVTEPGPFEAVRLRLGGVSYSADAAGECVTTSRQASVTDEMGCDDSPHGRNRPGAAIEATPVVRLGAPIESPPATEQPSEPTYPRVRLLLRDPALQHTPPAHTPPAHTPPAQLAKQVKKHKPAPPLQPAVAPTMATQQAPAPAAAAARGGMVWQPVGTLDA
eukprot:4557167-Prymnesium_polylepis.1